MRAPPTLLAITPPGVADGALAALVSKLAGRWQAAGADPDDLCVLVRAPAVAAGELARLVSQVVDALGPGRVGVNVGRHGVAELTEALQVRGVALPALRWVQIPENAAISAWKPVSGAALGSSVHRVEDIAGRLAAGADACLLSPIWPTASKPSVPPLGIASLQRAAVAHPGRIWALGGVTAGRVRACEEAGVAGVAAIGAAWSDDASALCAALAEMRASKAAHAAF